MIRFAHWAAIPLLVIMAGSGLEILTAYPMLGPSGDLYGWYPWQGVPPPGWLRFGGWLAGARHWHFALAWFLVANGAIYLVYLAVRSPEGSVPGRLIRRRLIGAAVTGALAAACARTGLGPALKVGGMVARPVTLSLEQLQRMPRADLRVRHHCVEGWSAVASWHGVRLRDLAEVVGADPRAGYVEFRSFDSGYWSSWDRESALHPQTILAYGMNGEPLDPTTERRSACTPR